MSSTGAHGNDRRRTSSSLTLCAMRLMLAGAMPLVCAAAQPAQPKQAPAAPKPARLADGTPNLTGFWVPAGGLMEVYRGPSGVTAPAVRSPPAAGSGAGGDSRAPKMPFSGYTPLKSPYKEQHMEYMKQAFTGRVADPVALCFPPGMPRMMGMVYGMELLQTPGQVAITSEWQAASRRIWLEEKKHPDPDELDPTYTGHSIGHWEGKTLVVDTVGIREDVPVDYFGLPHSPKLHVVERFTQTSPGILVDEITIDDPDAFTAPWKEIETYRYRPDFKLKEFTCLENNRNVGKVGEAVF